MSAQHTASRRTLAIAFLGLAASWPSLAETPPAVQLFRVTGLREDVFIGLTAAEFDAMGTEPGVERLARKLVSDGQITVWHYAVGRAPDGSTRFAAIGRVAILRNDALRIEPYAAALPVAPPPSGS